VEDDCDFAEVIACALEDSAVVTYAKSLLAARQVISNRRFDLIILDWNMPATI
jgi:DNA-binding response OmpR family regulator